MGADYIFNLPSKSVSRKITAMNSNKLQRLPVGIQDFRKIRGDGYLYLDKTEYIYNLIQSGEIYFLSRPRRFGKTLLVSTLECLFKCERELFQGLWIEDNWDWDKSWPVIRLDMSSILIKTAEEVSSKIINRIKGIAQMHGISQINETDHAEAFRSLIQLLSQKHNKKVVVLIDEYDSPIISNLNDIDKAKAIREEIRDFYRVLKSEEASLRFIFLTGVSKFSRAGVFSALNNLNDISIDERFAIMLGITQPELEDYFSSYITKLSTKEGVSKEAILEKIRFWYNGFCFDGANGATEKNTVYNPFSTLLLFDKNNFQNYWFESGSPKFLLDLLKQNEYNVPEIEYMRIDSDAFNSYEPDDLRIEALLFQTGYITIKDKESSDIYILSYPNYEVKRSFLRAVLDTLESINRGRSGTYIYDMKQDLKADPPEFEAFIEKFKAFFAKIPYDIHDRIKEKEQYYQSIIYAVLAMLGLEVRGEVRVAKGRIDLMFELNQRAFIIECKLNASADDAIEQIKKQGYANAYRGKTQKTYLIGISLDTQERNISDYKWELLSE